MAQADVEPVALKRARHRVLAAIRISLYLAGRKLQGLHPVAPAERPDVVRDVVCRQKRVRKVEAVQFPGAQGAQGIDDRGQLT